MVSIHAPVWGATRPMYVFILEMEFQSTHPCGVRLVVLKIYYLLLVSIHAPVWGATKALNYLLPSLLVSIHAPVWGATGNFAQL